MSRLPAPPKTGMAELDRWASDLIRSLEIELDRLNRLGRFPTFASTALPNAALPAFWIRAVGTSGVMQPAFNDGTAWRALGTGTTL